MLDEIKRSLSYANVTATLALFIALGGVSYAATQLPRDSVGSRQIRRNAVGSSEIRNRAVGTSEVRQGSLRASDLSRSARDSLRGRKGDPGAPGAAATKFFAAVSASGIPSRGNVTSYSHTAVGSGSYSIGFSQGVSGCAYAATLGSTDASTLPAGYVTVRDDGGRLGVQTYDASGVSADVPFHVLVAC